MIRGQNRSRFTHLGSCVLLSRYMGVRRYTSCIYVLAYTGEAYRRSRIKRSVDDRARRSTEGPHQPTRVNKPLVSRTEPIEPVVIVYTPAFGNYTNLPRVCSNYQIFLLPKRRLLALVQASGLVYHVLTLHHVILRFTVTHVCFRSNSLAIFNCRLNFPLKINSDREGE